jgi:hypothetical protein
MRVTRQMIEAARRGHYDYLQRNRLLGTGPAIAKRKAAIKPEVAIVRARKPRLSR